MCGEQKVSTNRYVRMCVALRLSVNMYIYPLPCPTLLFLPTYISTQNLDIYPALIQILSD